MSPCIITALLMAGIGSAVGLDVCVIDCSHGHSNTADPVNCKNYYICFDTITYSKYPFTCEGNMFFDISSHTCLETGYTCTPECEKCSFDCAAPVLDKIATTLDCGVYYTCSSSEWTTCPSDKPYFNGDVCQTDTQSCCTCKSVCTASDAANHVMVPDYRNCTNYYLCLEEGIPDQSTHGHCPTGNFDQLASECVVGSPCIQPCA